MKIVRIYATQYTCTLRPLRHHQSRRRPSEQPAISAGVIVLAQVSAAHNISKVCLAGGIFSTAVDMEKWMKFHLSGGKVGVCSQTFNWYSCVDFTIMHVDFHWLLISVITSGQFLLLYMDTYERVF